LGESAFAASVFVFGSVLESTRGAAGMKHGRRCRSGDVTSNLDASECSTDKEDKKRQKSMKMCKIK
jgi:hypothetical protein